METQSAASTPPGPFSVVQVLFSPTEVFGRIASQPRVLAAFVILVGFGLISTGVVVSRMDFEEVTRKQLENNPQFEKLPPEQREEQTEQAVAIASKIGPVAALAGALIMGPLLYVMITALFWILLKIIAGSDWGFKAALSTTLHCFAPGMVAGLLMIVVMVAADPSAIDIQDPLKSHLGALTDQETVGPFVYSMLQSLEIFSFWIIALMILGYKKVARVSTGSVAGVVIVCWGIYVLCKSALAAAFAGFGA